MVVGIAWMGAVTAAIASRLIADQETDADNPHRERLRGLEEQVSRLSDLLQQQRQNSSPRPLAASSKRWGRRFESAGVDSVE